MAVALEKPVADVAYAGRECSVGGSHGEEWGGECSTGIPSKTCHIGHVLLLCGWSVGVGKKRGG